MAFGHERLDVYQAATQYMGWAYRLLEVQFIDKSGSVLKSFRSGYVKKTRSSDSWRSIRPLTDPDSIPAK